MGSVLVNIVWQYVGFLTKMNKKSVKPLKVRFCPECRSTDVGFVFRFKNVFGLLPRVECYDCGHWGMEFPLLVVHPDELKKRNEKASAKKNSSGNKGMKRGEGRKKKKIKKIMVTKCF